MHFLSGELKHFWRHEGTTTAHYIDCTLHPVYFSTVHNLGKKLILLFSKDALNELKVTVKTFPMLQKTTKRTFTKIWSSATVFSINNNQISEGSCDTEDWSNDAENHRNKLYFKIFSNSKLFLIVIIFHKNIK